MQNENDLLSVLHSIWQAVSLVRSTIGLSDILAPFLIMKRIQVENTRT